MDEPSAVVDDPAPVEAAITDPAPVDEAPAPVETAPAPAGLGPDDIEQLRELTELTPALRDLAMRIAAAPTAGPEQNVEPDIEWDPYDPQSTAQFLEARDQKLLGQIQAMVAPLVDRHQGEVVGEAEQRATDILTDLAAQKGEFEGGQEAMTLARQYAETFMPTTLARYGPGPRAAEAALERGYEYVRALEQKIGSAAVERYKNELLTLSGAREEPGSGGNGGGVTVAAATGDEMDLARRYAQRA